jgi:hypothetical protein
VLGPPHAQAKDIEVGVALHVVTGEYIATLHPFGHDGLCASPKLGRASNTTASKSTRSENQFNFCCIRVPPAGLFVSLVANQEKYIVNRLVYFTAVRTADHRAVAKGITEFIFFLGKHIAK